MELSLSSKDFMEYIQRQLAGLFPDDHCICPVSFSKVFSEAINRIEYCFSHVTLEAYNCNGQTKLSHLHSDQYAVFLWFLSSSVWKDGSDEKLATKLFYLNKTLHGFSCMYDTGLPDIFLLLHICGTVLGKASYSDFFVAAQNCTVGAQNGKYPRIGQGVSLLPGSSIIGECNIGDRVSVGIGTTIYQKDIENNIVVFTGEDGNTYYKHKDLCWAQKLFNVTI